MPWDAAGKWIPEDDSVVTRLNGLLDSNSSYIQTARAAGTRTASRRGLLNSSIAAGAAESAAIAAGAPLASQDAQQTFQRNQAVLEGGINLSNTTTVNNQQNAAAAAAQAADFTGRSGLMSQEAEFTRQRDLLVAQGATEAQLREFTQRTAEQTAQLSSAERQQLLAADTNILQSQIAANSQLSSQYLQAFSTLASDPNIPANVRNAYIAEFQRVMTQGQNLINVVGTTPVNWGGTPTSPPQTNPTPIGTPIPAPTGPAPLPNYGGTPIGGGGGILGGILASAREQQQYA